MKAQNVRPFGVCIKIFSPAQIKMSIYSQQFIALYMAFFELTHNFWEAATSRIFLTDNKSSKCFFQTKAIVPALWRACDYVQQRRFKIAHIAGSVNTVADFLSKLCPRQWS